MTAGTKAKPRKAKKPALTLEQARDKVTEAVCELIAHPDIRPGLVRWFEGLATLLLRKLDEMDAQDAQAKA